MAAAAALVSRSAPAAELGGTQSCGGSAAAISTRSASPASARAERSSSCTPAKVMPSITRTSTIAVIDSGCMNGVMPPLSIVPMLTTAPVWYPWDGAEIRISTTRTTQKVRDIERDPRVAFCVDDQVAGEYLTLYGEAVIVAGERVTELTWPLLLAYMHPAEATARWERINADGSRVVIVLRPVSVTGREQVK